MCLHVNTPIVKGMYGMLDFSEFNGSKCSNWLTQLLDIIASVSGRAGCQLRRDGKCLGIFRVK